MTSSTPEPGRELERRDDAAVPARPNIDHDLTDSWVEVIRPITILAGQIAETSFVPAAFQGNPPAVAAAILHGRELGLAPMTALALTDPIKGKPTMKAEGLRALVLAAGHDLETTETTAARCVMRGRRRGSQRWTEIVWTIDQARAAGLMNKDTWRQYPRAMLQARTTTELLRLVFPDVIHGMGFAEEELDRLDDAGDATEAIGQAPAGPSTTVSRARTGARKAAARRPAASTSDEIPSTPPAPLEVDVPMPDTPAPSGPADDAPGPEEGIEDVPVMGDSGDLPQSPADQLPADLVAAAAEAPERDELADVVQLAADDPTGAAFLRGGPKVSAAQLRMLGALWSKLGVGDEDRRAYTETLIGHDLEENTTKSLSKREATFIIDGLTKIENLDQLDDAIARRLASQGADQ